MTLVLGVRTGAWTMTGVPAIFSMVPRGGMYRWVVERPSRKRRGSWRRGVIGGHGRRGGNAYGPQGIVYVAKKRLVSSSGRPGVTKDRSVEPGLEWPSKGQFIVVAIRSPYFVSSRLQHRSTISFPRRLDGAGNGEDCSMNYGEGNPVCLHWLSRREEIYFDRREFFHQPTQGFSPFASAPLREGSLLRREHTSLPYFHGDKGSRRCGRT